MEFTQDIGCVAVTPSLWTDEMKYKDSLLTDTGCTGRILPCEF